ncbi:Ethanolamine ammonia-lyase small subunit [Paraburkholderia sacchari]|uniref:ethanolamine ammonia-lyase subunit EutC n=1 Tax=Paraburkholderia sacchari TaxID=159450 RepID=UPI0039A6DBAC
MSDAVEKNPWAGLKAFTNARIALGRAGNGLPTAPLLAFNLSHAQARDAVHQPLDAEALLRELEEAGFTALAAQSAAPDRDHYLRRPDLGRRLSDESRAALGDAGRANREGNESKAGPDIVFVVGDGLSAFAAAKQALPLLQAVRERLNADAAAGHGWRVGPVVVARQARVALGDEIGELLGAKLVAMLIGERPGLSSPDSLGVYLTWAPKVGCHDAMRNCISNVRPEGLPYDGAAHKLHYLLTHARRLGLTGVGLKDDSDALLPEERQKMGRIASSHDAV